MAKSIFAQDASLYLQVVDQNSSYIQNVTVKIKAGNKTLTKKTKEISQNFTFSDLKIGKYVLEVEAPKFKPYSQEIEIKTDSNEITVKLDIAEIIENVDVNQDTQETSVDNAFSNFLTRAQIEMLPDDPEELKKELKRIVGDDNVIISIDGFTSGGMPQKSQIASIRIVRSSFDAENHELGYTYVNVATKPGNQKFSGSISFNFNDKFLNARNAFSLQHLPEQTKNTIFFLNGPIKKDKAAFSLTIINFRNFKFQNINAALPQGVVSDQVKSAYSFTTVNTTINQNLSKYHNAKFDYTFTNTDSQNIGVGGFNLAERAFNVKTLLHQFRFSDSGYIGKKYLNELRLQFENENSDTLPQSENVGVIVLDSFNKGGAGNLSKSDKMTLGFADNLLFGYGKHALKAGLLIDFERRHENSETNKNGTFIFSSLADFNLSKPSLFTQNPATKQINLLQLQFGIFIQDDLRVKKNLNLSFGLRYETQNHLEDYNNFSPRIGITWSPLKTGKLTFRGGIGLFYNWLETRYLSTILSNDFLQPSETIIINPSFPNPISSGAMQSLPKSFWQKADNLKSPYIIHTSIGAESRLSKSLLLRTTFVYQKGLHQFRSRNTNAPFDGVRPNTDFGNITYIESSAFFVKNSLEIGLNAKLRKDINFYLNYNLSKTISDSSGIFGLPSDNYNLKLDRGADSNDQRHKVSTSISWEIRKGLRLSGSYLIGSSLPYTITTGKDNNYDTNFNDRPFGIKRNSERGTWKNQLDLTVSYAFSFINKKGNDEKSFAVITTSSEAATGYDSTDSKKRLSLKLYATANNILNQTNISRFAGVQTSPFFRQPILADNARRIEFGTRFNF